MIKKYGRAACLALLGLSLFFNLVQWRGAHPKQPPALHGTYALERSWPTPSEYLTFPGDGSYYLYRESRLLSRGTVAADSYPAYGLEEKSGESAAHLFLADGVLYRTEGEELLIYKKTLEKPVFINFSPTEEP